MKRSLALSWVVVLGLGCAHAGAQDAQGRQLEPRDYYPLSVGTAWEYEVVALGAPPEIEKVEIVKQEAGATLDTKGGRIWSDAFGIRDDKRYLLRKPLEVGAEWTNVVSVSSTERYRVAAVGAGCVAPSGSYENCVTVESRNRIKGDDYLVNEIVFAPGVGIVRVTTTLETPTRVLPQVSLRLMRFASAAATAPK
jgi:hypothetical protein